MCMLYTVGYMIVVRARYSILKYDWLLTGLCEHGQYLMLFIYFYVCVCIHILSSMCYSALPVVGPVICLPISLYPDGGAWISGSGRHGDKELVL